MPNFHMMLRLVGAAVLIAMSWMPPASATDSERTASDNFMPVENSHVVASVAAKAGHVKKVVRTKGAAPKIAAPRGHANSRTAVGAGRRSASFKVASTYERVTGCPASRLCPAYLILGIGY
jgi:hypothetical protein